MTKFSVNFYWVMGGLLTACLFSVMIFAADVSFAHPSRQEGGQPALTAGIQTSELLAEGPTVIITLEIPTTPTATHETPTTMPETPTATPETPTATPETPTATPETPTATPETPTATPETPTATPTGPVVKIEPETLVLNSCAATGSQSVTVRNVTNLMAIQTEVAFDPAHLQVVDMNPESEGIQIEVGSVFIDGFVAQNEVDETEGRVFFVATLVGNDTIEGEAELFTIEWLSQATGTSAISLENTLLIDSGGQVIDTTLQNGSVQVGDTCQSISGSVTLQGRDDHSGIMITSDTGVQTHTNPDGSFSIGGGALLAFQYPGYLSAQANVPALLQLPQAALGDDSQTTGLGSITLLAGDVNGDQRIDIADLAYIAQNYQSTDPVADFNADGIVNIYDLALAANNFQQQGPLTAWQETH